MSDDIKKLEEAYHVALNRVRTARDEALAEVTRLEQASTKAVRAHENEIGKLEDTLKEKYHRKECAASELAEKTQKEALSKNNESHLRDKRTALLEYTALEKELNALKTKPAAETTNTVENSSETIKESSKKLKNALESNAALKSKIDELESALKNALESNAASKSKIDELETASQAESEKLKNALELNEASESKIEAAKEHYRQELVNRLGEARVANGGGKCPRIPLERNPKSVDDRKPAAKREAESDGASSKKHKGGRKMEEECPHCLVKREEHVANANWHRAKKECLQRKQKAEKAG